METTKEGPRALSDGEQVTRALALVNPKLARRVLDALPLLQEPAWEPVTHHVRCFWLRAAAFVFRTLATPLKRAHEKRPAFKWPWDKLTPVLLVISFTAGEYRWPRNHRKSELPQWHQSQELIHKSSASRLNRVLNETWKSPYLTHQATAHSYAAVFTRAVFFLEKQTWLLCSCPWMSNSRPIRAAYEEERNEFNLSPSRGWAKFHTRQTRTFASLVAQA